MILKEISDPHPFFHVEIACQSTLIGQLGTVHIRDWLTKVKQIYEHGMSVGYLHTYA